MVESTATMREPAPIAASISLLPAVSETMRCGAVAGIVMAVPLASFASSGVVEPVVPPVALVVPQAARSKTQIRARNVRASEAREDKAVGVVLRVNLRVMRSIHFLLCERGAPRRSRHQ